MPDIGLVELALIGLIGFLVLGPERLPEFLGQMGRFVRQGKTWFSQLQRQLADEKRQLQQPVEEAKQSVEAMVQSIDETRKIKPEE